MITAGILKSSMTTGSDADLLCLFAAPVTITSNQPAFAQDSMNLRRIAASQNIQRWEVEARIAPANGSGSADYAAHSVTVGHNTPFWIRPPQPPNVKCSPSGVRVAAAASVNTDTISITGAASMVAGELITFSNHSKVYMVVSAGAAGVGIRVSPKLRKALTAGISVATGANVAMRVLYDNSVNIGITYTDGVLSDPGAVKMIEALA